MTGPIAVSAAGRITPGCAGLYNAAHAAAWKRIVAAIHEHSQARVALQLNHAGRRGSTRPRQEGLDRPLREGNWPLVSASPMAYTSRSQTPGGIDRAEMERVRDDFVRGARMGLQAGFDMLQVHAAHGYLLASFISPLTNRRHDEFGATLENRMRFPLEVVDAVRTAWPQDRPISVSLSASDCVKDGLLLDEAVAAARMFHSHGADVICVLAGQTTADGHPAYGRGFLTALSDHVRNEARVPVMTSGYLTTTDEVNSILAAGRADLCILDPPNLDRTPGPDAEQEATPP
jgi:anthraniloyl-CoA monooxygenase